VDVSRVVPEGIETIADRLAVSAQTWPHAEVVFPHERETFADLEARAGCLARVLLACGVRPGDKVAILLDPGLDFIATMFATAMAGATVVSINERLKALEIRHLVGHCDATVLVTTDRIAEHLDFPALVTEAFPDLAEHLDGDLHLIDASELKAIVVIGGADQPAGFTPIGELDHFAAAVTDDAIRAASAGRALGDLAFIMYTSGTSALPKGAMVTHEAVLRQGETMARSRYRIAAGDAFWCPLPLFHNGAVASLMVCLSVGANYCHSGHFDPGVALRMLHDERCTHGIPAFETILMRILDHPDRADADLSALKVMLNVGSEQRLREFQTRLPNAIQISNYGLTEAAGHLSVGDVTDPLDIRVTTGGKMLPGMEARILDPATGTDLPTGEVGEIVFRGPTRIVGYYKDPELTTATIDSEGWLHTGDLGVFDDGGRLTYRGRLKDMLKVGGENVSAPEVEGFLVGHPAVNIAIVVGAPDGVYTEVPTAFIELAPGATATEEEIIDFCLGSIATFKVPRYVRFVDEWPMSGTKVKKYVLRERIAMELAEKGVEAAPRLDTRNRSRR
jgi:fatty-acyl-CoA synthase